MYVIVIHAMTMLVGLSTVLDACSQLETDVLLKHVQTYLINQQ